MKLRSLGLIAGLIVGLSLVGLSSTAHADPPGVYCQDQDVFILEGYCPIRQEEGPPVAPFSPADVGGEFEAWAALPGVVVHSGDFTGDGHMDAALTGGPGWNTVPVAVSNGNGSFTVSNSGQRALAAAGGAAPVQVSIGDLELAGFGGTTAYDVMRDFNLRTQLGDRLAGPLPGWSALDYVGERLIQAVLAFINQGDGAVEVKVVFSDGSSLVYKVPAAGYTAIYQVDRSEMPNGQRIPEANTAPYQGTYSGHRDDLGEWVEHLDRIGATVMWTVPGAGGSSSGRWACVVTGDSWSCTFVIY